MSENRNREYEQMTVPELEQRLRETFFYTDTIDDTVYQELEQLRTILEQKQPVEFPVSARESWESFARDHGEELERICAASARAGKVLKTRRMSALLRSVLIAAVVVVFLTGVALAANSLGLWAWVPRWNAAAGRYEPAAQEVSGENPIPAALRELGITEPVYPARLPNGFVITESHISEDPLVMMEQYTRGNERLSITITPVKAVKSTIFQKSGATVREYRSGAKAFFLFQNEGTITAVWFTKDYATTISANLSVEEITAIIDSIDATSEGGQLT